MTINDLITRILGDDSPSGPAELMARSVYLVQHGTRLAGSPQLFRNRYVMVRCESAFGVCSVAEGTVTDAVIELSGSSIAELLRHECEAVRVAALEDRKSVV